MADQSEEIIKTRTLVKQILEQYPETRNSDAKLQYRFYQVYFEKMGIELQKVPTSTFFYWLDFIKDCPKLETIRRSRQFIQESHEELRATKEVQELRSEAEIIYSELMKKGRKWQK